MIHEVGNWAAKIHNHSCKSFNLSTNFDNSAFKIRPIAGMEIDQVFA